MDNGDYTIPPYHVGDLFAPYGSASWRGMVVSVKDAHHGSAVSLELMDYDFTDYSHTITELFEKYHLSYNKSGRKLSQDEVNLEMRKKCVFWRITTERGNFCFQR